MKFNTPRSTKFDIKFKNVINIPGFRAATFQNIFALRGLIKSITLLKIPERLEGKSEVKILG